MGVIERYNELKVKAIKNITTSQVHHRAYDEYSFKYNEVVKQLTNDKESLRIQEFSVDALKEIIDKMSSEHIERVVNLLSYALQVIFYDKEYSVELVMGDKRNSKTAEFYLVEQRDGQIIRTEFDDGIGGGIQVVVGFVLQVFYIQYLGLSPIMFCDESFSQLSDIYIPYLKEFINQLAERMGFIFVLITHDSRLVYGVARVYQVDQGVIKQISESEGLAVVSKASKEGDVHGAV